MTHWRALTGFRNDPYSQSLSSGRTGARLVGGAIAARHTDWSIEALYPAVSFFSGPALPVPGARPPIFRDDSRTCASGPLGPASGTSPGCGPFPISFLLEHFVPGTFRKIPRGRRRATGQRNHTSILGLTALLSASLFQLLLGTARISATVYPQPALGSAGRVADGDRPSQVPDRTHFALTAVADRLEKPLASARPVEIVFCSDGLVSAPGDGDRRGKSHLGCFLFLREHAGQHGFWRGRLWRCQPRIVSFPARIAKRRHPACPD